MKKLKLLLTGFLSLQILNVSGQQALDEDLGTPSGQRPGGQSQYIDQGIDLSTGVVTPKIHLTELESYGGQKVSVDLVYTSAQGVRVADVASRAGLGWEVITGGSLRRIMKGIRDEKQIGSFPWDFDSDKTYDVGWLEDAYYFSQDDVGSSYFSYYLTTGNTIASDCFSHLLDVNFPDPTSVSFPIGGELNSDQARAVMLRHMMLNKDKSNLDPEPDIFMFNFGNYSGKFVFDEHRQIVLLPHQNIKIEVPAEFGGTGSSWIFTTPDGIKYVFENNSAYTTTTRTTSYFGGFPTGIPPRESEYISEWNLTKIIGNGIDLFTFSYNTKPDYSIFNKVNNLLLHSGNTRKDVNDDSEFCDPGDEFDCPPVQPIETYERKIGEKEIEQIESPYGRIDFVNETDPAKWRKDMWYYYPLVHYYAHFPLKNIFKYTAEGSLLKNFEFETDYFNHNGTGGPPTESSYNNIWHNNAAGTMNLYQRANQANRLKLVALWEHPTNGPGTDLKYSFQYNDENVSLLYHYEPFDDFYKQDWWGFFKNNGPNDLVLCNSNINGTYGLPEITNGTHSFNDPVTGSFGIYWLWFWPWITGVDKSPSNDTKALILTGITFPSGSKTVYDYELNHVYSTNQDFGGLRIKYINNYDMHGSFPGNTISTEYSYDIGEVAPDHRKNDFLRYYCKADNFWVMLQILSQPYRENSAELIRYKHVEVKQQSTGKTVYEMTGFSDYPDEEKVRKSYFSSGACSSCMEHVIHEDWSGLPGTGNTFVSDNIIHDFTEDYDDDPGAPMTDMSYRRGLINSIKYYQEGSNDIVKEIEYTYEIDAPTTGYIPKEVAAYRVNSSYHFVWDGGGGINGNDAYDHALPQYNIDIFKYHSGIINLMATTEKTYEIVAGVVNPSHIFQKMTSYRYVDGDPTRLRTKYIANVGCNGSYFEQYKYATDYGIDLSTSYTTANANGLKELLLHYQIATPVQVLTGFTGGVASNLLTTWINGGTLHTFRKHGSGQYSFVSPYETYSIETDVPLDPSLTYSDVSSNVFVYDPHFIPKSQSDVNWSNFPVHTFATPESHSSIQYDHGNRFPMAKFSNANINGQECSFEGFEYLNTAEISDIGWNSGSSSFLDPSAHTGGHSRKITPNSTGPQETFFPARQPEQYKFSAWIKASNSSGELIMDILDNSGIYQTSKSIAFNNLSAWTYQEVSLDLSDYIPIYGTNLKIRCKITNTDPSNLVLADDIRFNPLFCSVTSYTYDWRYRVTSTSNDKSLPIYSYYDEWDRPSHTENEKHKLLGATEYYFRPWGNTASNDKHWTAQYKFIREVNWSGGWSDQDYLKSVTYTDDFGRIIQTQGINQSPSQSNIIQHFEFESYNGRKPREYLPYTIDGEPGYRPNAHYETFYFYDPNNYVQGNSYPPPSIARTDLYPYAETVFDNSPLSQTVQQGSPGMDWQCSNSASLNPHPKKIDFSINLNIQQTLDDYVWVWFLKNGGVEGAYVNNEHEYGSLFKTVTTDEDGNIAKTYQDKLGNILLKRVVVPTIKDNGSGGTLNYITTDYTKGTDQEVIIPDPFVYETYYIYDEFNRKAYEIPPGAMQIFKENYPIIGVSAFDFTANFNDKAFWEFIYAYKYDEKGRLKAKKTPGTDWVYYVYDKNDRVVLSQNPNQRNPNLVIPEWSFAKYDEMGRTIMTGIYRTNSLQPALQNDANNSATKLYEKRTTDYLIDHGYTNIAFPSLNSGDDILVVNYYDTYDANWTGAFSFGGSPFNAIKTDMTFGEKTGSIVRTLNAVPNTDLLSVYYYNDHYNLIQGIADNHLAGNDIYYTDYDWAGKLMQMQRLHSSNLLPVNPLSITNFYQYDQSGRMISENEKIGGDGPIELAHYAYNELGQIIKKSLHGRVDDQNNLFYLQHIDYRYNIRGWLRKINNSYLDVDVNISDPDNLDVNDVFGEELLYTQDDILNAHCIMDPSAGTILERYNGNTAAMLWKHKAPTSDPSILPRNIYCYRYDGMSRMTAGYYARSENTNPFNFIKDLHWYDETINYDIQGNPNNLKRIGQNNTILDDLTYDYIKVAAGSIGSFYSNGNRLNAILEDGNPQGWGFVDGANLAIEYEYDDNASVKKDHNKQAITDYTHFGLPATVTLSNNTPGTLQYTYDASGKKLTETSNGLSTTTHQYVDDVEYINGQLAWVVTSEGKVRYTLPSASNTTEFVYDYFIKDHLDNVRVVLTEEIVSDKKTATMEDQNNAQESGQFLNVPETREDKPLTAPADSTYSPDEKVSMLNPLRRIGHAKILPVIQGDKVDFDTRYYFQSQSGYTNNSQSLQSIFSQLINIFSSNPVQGISSVEWQSIVQNSFGNNPGLTNFLTASIDTSDTTGTPQAFLTWLFFNDRLEFIEEASGVLHADQPDILGDLAIINHEMPENGYLYVYVNNESNQDVSFDNLRIRYNPGRVLQFNNYYPYGLTWRAVSVIGDKHLMTTKEWNDELALNEYDFGIRNYDPATIRWYVQDPAEQFANPYIAMGNNPANFIDPNGAFLAVPFFSHALLTDFTCNLLNGVSDPLGTAYKNASSATNGVSNSPKINLYTSRNTSLTAGIDAFNMSAFVSYYHRDGDFTYNATVSYGYGGWNAFAGVNYSTGKFQMGTGGGYSAQGFQMGGGMSLGPFGYNLNYFGGTNTPGGGKQWVAGLSYRKGDFHFTLENDMFTFQKKDRWRTGGFEIGYGQFSVGSYIVTNDPQGEGSGVNNTESKLFGPNAHGFGAWEDGWVYSSPLYLGYRNGNMVSRTGVNASVFQDVQQNWIHRYFRIPGIIKGYQNYYNQYDYASRYYFYGGVYNPYTIY